MEIESKKVLMETLQGKLAKLQEVTKNQEADIELQVKKKFKQTRVEP